MKLLGVALVLLFVTTCSGAANDADARGLADLRSRRELKSTMDEAEMNSGVNTKDEAMKSDLKTKHLPGDFLNIPAKLPFPFPNKYAPKCYNERHGKCVPRGACPEATHDFDYNLCHREPDHFLTKYPIFGKCGCCYERKKSSPPTITPRPPCPECEERGGKYKRSRQECPANYLWKPTPACGGAQSTCDHRAEFNGNAVRGYPASSISDDPRGLNTKTGLAWEGVGNGNSNVAFPAISLAGPSFTVAMHIKIDDRDHDIGWFSYGRYSTCGFMCQIRVAQSGDIHCRAGHGPLDQFNSPRNAVTRDMTSQWIHLAVVKDGNKIHHYVNGKLKGSNYYRNGDVPACKDGFRIGGWPGDNSKKSLDGMIDGLRVFTSAKSAAEVAALSSACSADSQPRAAFTAAVRSEMGECRAQAKNLGKFTSPELCAAAAAKAGCSSFMHSKSYPAWGCRCCKVADPAKSHPLWTVYDVVKAAAEEAAAPRGAPPQPWTKCADEHRECRCHGDVKYGKGVTWTAPRRASGVIACTNSVFGDPLVGTVKECLCRRPMGLVPAAPAPAPQLGGCCSPPPPMTRPPATRPPTSAPPTRPRTCPQEPQCRLQRGVCKASRTECPAGHDWKPELCSGKHPFGARNEQKKVCRGISPVSSDAWCEATCNHNPPKCPAALCRCEAPAPVQEGCGCCLPRTLPPVTRPPTTPPPTRPRVCHQDLRCRMRRGKCANSRTECPAGFDWKPELCSNKKHPFAPATPGSWLPSACEDDDTVMYSRAEGACDPDTYTGPGACDGNCALLRSKVAKGLDVSDLCSRMAGKYCPKTCGRCSTTEAERRSFAPPKNCKPHECASPITGNCFAVSPLPCFSGCYYRDPTNPRYCTKEAPPAQEEGCGCCLPTTPPPVTRPPVTRPPTKPVTRPPTKPMKCKLHKMCKRLKGRCRGQDQCPDSFEWNPKYCPQKGPFDAAAPRCGCCHKPRPTRPPTPKPCKQTKQCRKAKGTCTSQEACPADFDFRPELCNKSKGCGCCSRPKPTKPPVPAKKCKQSKKCARTGGKCMKPAECPDGASFTPKLCAKFNPFLPRDQQCGCCRVKKTSRPTPDPTRRPTRTPTPDPTRRPTRTPTPDPTKLPTRTPTPDPTKLPTRTPTPDPTARPTRTPTPDPTRRPTRTPTPDPTKLPTRTPTPDPTKLPTRTPTPDPTRLPTRTPTTARPSSRPTERCDTTDECAGHGGRCTSKFECALANADNVFEPKLCAFVASSAGGTIAKTAGKIVVDPTSGGDVVMDERCGCCFAATSSPTSKPTPQPSKAPTDAPSSKPTPQPSKSPSKSPTTANPTTVAPTSSKPSASPSKSPSASPSKRPSKSPTAEPSKKPTAAPTDAPSEKPSKSPTKAPSASPSKSPSESPSAEPTAEPSKKPTAAPTDAPSAKPSKNPTKAPSASPSKSPSESPSAEPTAEPSKKPTAAPTDAPSAKPSKSPTKAPSASPSKSPSGSPSAEPTARPTATPTDAPSKDPTARPTAEPTTEAPTTETPTTSAPSEAFFPVVDNGGGFLSFGNP